MVLELKVARPGKKTLAQALAEGTRQLRAMDTLPGGAPRFRRRPIHAFVVAFDGKTVQVRAVHPRKRVKNA